MLKTLDKGEGADLKGLEASRLLAWYDEHGRSLPWRGVTGREADYKVWLSEIMLQQTTIATVTPYYDAFIARWPRLKDLAASSLDDVLKSWAGLGYYARARNLHKCARTVMADHNGRFPLDEATLLKLPGIGPYTAAAMAAILADAPCVVVDGNVERVISRLYALDTPLPKAKPEIRRLASLLTPQIRSGDYAQAIMDLGATICTPRSPKCRLCPWQAHCAAQKAGTAQDYPKKERKAEKPQRFGTVFWVEDDAGSILLEKRPEKGLFGGMWAFPGTRWDERHATCQPTEEEIASANPGNRVYKATGLHIRHVFTHFDLKLDIATSKAEGSAIKGNAAWVEKSALLDMGLPTAMKKVATLMLKEWPRSPVTPPE